MLEYIIFAILVMGLLYYRLFYKDDYNDYKPTINIEDEFQEEIAEERLEEIIPSPEPIYRLQTHAIKYLIYNPDYLNHYKSRELYQMIILQNHWFNDLFYPIVFKILLLIDKDEFFIKDPNSRVIITNLREKNNQMKKIKSYQVFSSLEIVKSFFDYAIEDILKFKKDDAQDITLACFLMILSKSKHFETLKNYNLDDLYLENYERKVEVKHILDLIKTNDDQLKFIQESLLKVFNTTRQKPYVEKPNEVLQVQSLPKLPPKILMHI
jgi:hypothetical protein